MTRNHFTPCSMSKLVSRIVQRMGIRQEMKARPNFFGWNQELMQDVNDPDSLDYETIDKNISDSGNSADSAYSDLGTNSEKQKLLYDSDTSTDNDASPLLIRQDNSSDLEQEIEGGVHDLTQRNRWSCRIKWPQQAAGMQTRRMNQVFIPQAARDNTPRRQRIGHQSLSTITWLFDLVLNGKMSVSEMAPSLFLNQKLDQNQD